MKTTEVIIMNKFIFYFSVFTCFSILVYSSQTAHSDATYSKSATTTTSTCAPLFPTSKESSEIPSSVVKMVLASNYLHGQKSIKLNLKKAEKILTAYESQKFVWHKIRHEYDGKMRCGISFQPVGNQSKENEIVVLIQD
jgi:hypothetical protein